MYSIFHIEFGELSGEHSNMYEISNTICPKVVKRRNVV